MSASDVFPSLRKPPLGDVRTASYDMDDSEPLLWNADTDVLELPSRATMIAEEGIARATPTDTLDKVRKVTTQTPRAGIGGRGKGDETQTATDEEPTFDPLIGTLATTLAIAVRGTFWAIAIK